MARRRASRRTRASTTRPRGSLFALTTAASRSHRIAAYAGISWPHVTARERQSHHGKEGVAGSSPAEGSRNRAIARFSYFRSGSGDHFLSQRKGSPVRSDTRGARGARCTSDAPVRHARPEAGNERAPFLAAGGVAPIDHRSRSRPRAAAANTRSRGELLAVVAAQELRRPALLRVDPVRSHGRLNRFGVAVDFDIALASIMALVVSRPKPGDCRAAAMTTQRRLEAACVGHPPDGERAGARSLRRGVGKGWRRALAGASGPPRTALRRRAQDR
jgi:hypothetical protein